MRTFLFSALSLGLTALAILAPPTAQAQYKWRDSGGVIMYSDRPPPTGSGQVIILKAPAVRVGASGAAAAPAAPQQVAVAATGTPADKHLADKMAEKTALAKAKETEQNAQKAKDIARQCDMLRATLKAYDTGERIAKVNDKGEREFLGDAERSNRSNEIRKDIAGNCK